MSMFIHISFVPHLSNKVQITKIESEKGIKTKKIEAKKTRRAEVNQSNRDKMVQQIQ